MDHISKIMPNLEARAPRKQEKVPECPKYPELENIFVFGDVGVGKTYWANELMNELIGQWDAWRAWKVKYENQFSLKSGSDAIKFYSCSELMVKAKQLSKSGELMESLFAPTYIVLDDFFVSSSFNATDVLYAVIEGRMRRNKKTLITSNQTLEVIGGIEDRLASRLATFKQIHINGKDRRVADVKVIEINNGD